MATLTKTAPPSRARPKDSQTNTTNTKRFEDNRISNKHYTVTGVSIPERTSNPVPGVQLTTTATAASGVQPTFPSYRFVMTPGVFEAIPKTTDATPLTLVKIPTSAGSINLPQESKKEKKSDTPKGESSVQSSSSLTDISLQHFSLLKNIDRSRVWKPIGPLTPVTQGQPKVMSMVTPTGSNVLKPTPIPIVPVSSFSQANKQIKRGVDIITPHFQLHQIQIPKNPMVTFDKGIGKLPQLKQAPVPAKLTKIGNPIKPPPTQKRLSSGKFVKQTKSDLQPVANKTITLTKCSTNKTPSPLKPASDTVVCNTTTKTREDQINQVKKKKKKKKKSSKSKDEKPSERNKPTPAKLNSDDKPPSKDLYSSIRTPVKASKPTDDGKGTDDSLACSSKSWDRHGDRATVDEAEALHPTKEQNKEQSTSVKESTTGKDLKLLKSYLIIPGLQNWTIPFKIVAQSDSTQATGKYLHLWKKNVSLL